MSNWTLVCTTAELLPGEMREAQVDGASVLVINLDGDYYALENACSHDGGELLGGALEDLEVVCPRHGARFDIRTGEALCAPAYEPIASLPVKVVDEQVYVRDDRW